MTEATGKGKGFRRPGGSPEAEASAGQGHSLAELFAVRREPSRAAAAKLGFKTAARAATQSAPGPKRKKRIASGGKGGPFTAGALAGDYLALCRNPFSDLQRWLDEDRKVDRISAFTSHGNPHEQQHTSRTGNTEQFLRDALREMSSWVGQSDNGKAHRGDLPAQSRAGAGQPHSLQQVSAGANLGGAGNGDESRKLGRALGELFNSTAAMLERAALTCRSKDELGVARRHIIEQREAAALWLIERFRDTSAFLNRKERAAQRPPDEFRRVHEPFVASA